MSNILCLKTSLDIRFPVKYNGDDFSQIIGDHILDLFLGDSEFVSFFLDLPQCDSPVKVLISKDLLLRLGWFLARFSDALQSVPSVIL